MSVARCMTTLVVLLMTLINPPTPAQAYTPPPSSPVGIEVGRIYDYNELAQVMQAGVAWTRIAGIWWPDIEPIEGNRNWESLRRMDVELAQAHAIGLQVVLVIRGAPIWAQKYEGISCGPIRSDKVDAFASFMTDLVRRYAAAPYHVKYWEIGNEPDIDPKLVAPDSLWGCWGDDSDYYYGGAEYAKMLAQVYPRVKAVDSSAIVLIGGLVLDCLPSSASGCADEQRRRPARFLEGILRAKGGMYFDGVSFHSYDYYQKSLGTYSNTNFASDVASSGPVLIAKARYIRTLLKQYRVGNKLIINSEYALLCSQCEEPTTPEYEWTKAYYVAQANTAAHANAIHANIWFRLSFWPGVALVDDQLSPTLAYSATRVSATFLEGSKFIRELTSVNTRNSAIRGYEFRKDDKRVWVLWNTGNAIQTHKLPSTPERVRDVLGRIVYIANRNLVFRPMDRLLYYIEW